MVGHLADSARIFAERINRVRTEADLGSCDFVTDEEPGSTATWTRCRADLVDELEAAQDLLEEALAADRR